MKARASNLMVVDFVDEDIDGAASPTLVLVEGPAGLLEPHFLDELVGALNERLNVFRCAHSAMAVMDLSAHDSGSAPPWATRAGTAAHSRIKGIRNRERLCFIVCPFSHISKTRTTRETKP